MNLPNYERGMTTALTEAVSAIDGHEVVTSPARLGTIQLEDGRRAQIQIVVTTNEDDFILETR